MATSCKELTHWKRLWCWEGLGAGGEGDDRGWDGWMASLTRWTWVWVHSGSWWWIGRPGVLWFMGSQRVGHDWATELNWTEDILIQIKCLKQCWHLLKTRPPKKINPPLQQNPQNPKNPDSWSRFYVCSCTYIQLQQIFWCIYFHAYIVNIYSYFNKLMK